MITREQKLGPILEVSEFSGVMSEATSCQPHVQRDARVGKRHRRRRRVQQTDPDW